MIFEKSGINFVFYQIIEKPARCGRCSTNPLFASYTVIIDEDAAAHFRKLSENT